jgi:hypothetical protein
MWSGGGIEKQGLVVVGDESSWLRYTKIAESQLGEGWDTGSQIFFRSRGSRKLFSRGVWIPVGKILDLTRISVLRGLRDPLQIQPHIRTAPKALTDRQWGNSLNKLALWLIHRKGFFPVKEVHVPHQTEGFPSGQRGTCTSSATRKSFRSMRYIHLIDRKKTVPVNLARRAFFFSFFSEKKKIILQFYSWFVFDFIFFIFLK